jgi:hypothetical protein
VVSQEVEQKCCEHENGHHPPIPTDAARLGTGGAKFFINELIVIELVIGQIESAGFRRLRPSGFLAGTAFRAGFGFGRDVRAAIGASHEEIKKEKFKIKNLKRVEQSYGNRFKRIAPSPQPSPDGGEGETVGSFLFFARFFNFTFFIF